MTSNSSCVAYDQYHYPDASHNTSDDEESFAWTNVIMIYEKHLSLVRQ